MLAVRFADNVAPPDEAIERECSVATASVMAVSLGVVYEAPRAVLG